MKKRKLALIGFTISILTLVFIVIMLDRRFFLFGDDLNNKMKTNLKVSLNGFITELQDIQKKMESFSSDDIIVNTLSQFSMGESIEKGTMEIQQVKNSVQFASAIKLISMEDKVVVNTESSADEGSLLKDEEGRGEIKKSFLKLRKTGEVIMFVPCFTKSKRYIGKLIVNFERKLFLTQFKGMGKNILNSDYFISEGAVFYNFSREYIAKNSIASISSKVLKNKNNTQSEDKLNIVKLKDEKTGLIFVYGLDRSQVALPAIAMVLLILNILISVAFLVLILLYNRTEKKHQKEQSARESVDILGKEIEKNGDYADKIIEETEKMFEKQEKEMARLKMAIESSESEQTVEQEISLSQVIDSSEDSREFLTSSQNEGLHNIIDKISESLEKSNVNNIGKSILSFSDIDSYVSELHGMLKTSYDLPKHLIFKILESGTFIMQKESGFSDIVSKNFMLNSSDQIIEKVIEQKKIFFVKDVLENSKYAAHNLKLLELKKLQQLAFLPVIQDKSVIALIMIFVEDGENRLTIEKLYELRLLTLV